MFFHILFTVFKGLLEMDGYVVEKKPGTENTAQPCCPDQGCTSKRQ